MNNKIAIICDTSTEFNLDKLNDEIAFIETEINVDGKRILKNIHDSEMSLNVFYSYLSNNREFKTHFIYPKLFIEKAAKFLKDKYDIIFLTCSSKLSNNYNSCLVAKQYLEKHHDNKIVLIDSKGFSSKEYLILEEIISLKNEGHDVLKIKEIIENNFSNKLYYQFAILDDVSHLENSGRLSKELFNFSRLLNIKPIYQINNSNEVKLLRKVVNYDNALENLLLIIKDVNDKLTVEKIKISYTANRMDAINFANRLISELKIKNIELIPMNLISSSYLGMNSISVSFKVKGDING